MNWDANSQTLSGIPTNSNAENFTILFEFWDQYSINEKQSHEFDVEVKPNSPPILQNINDIHTLVPGVTLVLSASVCQDPEYHPLVMTISMADATILPSFFTWIEESRTFLIDPTDDGAGIYQLRFTCHDSMHDALTSDFKVTIIRNLSP